MLRTVYIRNVKKKNVPFVYRTCILYSFFMSKRCSLWRSTFFSTVREYGKTDCIRVNCNVHGNISGIEEGRQILLLFSKISNVLRYVLSRLSTYFLCHEFIHTFIHTFIYTFVHIFIRTFHIYIYTYVCSYVYKYVYAYVHTCITKEQKRNT